MSSKTTQSRFISDDARHHCYPITVIHSGTPLPTAMHCFRLHQSLCSRAFHYTISNAENPILLGTGTGEVNIS